MRLLLFSLLLLISTTGTAQSFSTLRFSYLGNYAFQPGLKGSIDLDLFEKAGEKSVLQIYTQPSLAFYSHLDANSNVIIGTESGLKRTGTKGLETTVGLGLNGCYRASLLSATYDLGSGEPTAGEYEHRFYFLPNLSLGLGKSGEKIGWFMKLSPSYFLSGKYARTFALFGEAGISIKLNKEEK